MILYKKALRATYYLFFFTVLVSIPLYCGSSMLPDSVIVSLLNAAGVPETIKYNDIYHSSNPVTTRSIHSLPFNAFSQDNDHEHIKATPFYNGILNGIVFNSSGSSLYTSAFNLSSFTLPNGNDILDGIFDNQALRNVNFPVIKNLFDRIYVQQHRLGLALDYHKPICNDYFLTISWPFLYQAHNINLEPDMRSRFVNELDLPFAVANQPSNIAAVEQWVKDHFVSDIFGMGDLAVEFGLKINQCEEQYNVSYIGLQTVFPAEIRFSKGLIGSFFDPQDHNYLPELDISKVGNSLATNPASTLSSFQEIIEQMFDRVMSALYQKTLGNEHFEIGINGAYEIPISSYCNMGVKGKLQYEIPRERYRYAFVKVPPSQFDRNYDDAAKATENLHFLRDALLYEMLLYPFTAQVSPGGYLQAEWFTRILSESTNILFGLDFWFHTKENISKLDMNNAVQLKYSSEFKYVERPASLQFKIFGHIESEFKFADICGNYGVWGDTTVYAQDIGKETTLGLFCTFTF